MNAHRFLVYHVRPLDALMFELWRNNYFCFPSGLNVSLDFFSGILRPLAKENQLFPSGADFKRITVVNIKVILSVMYTT